MSDTAADVIGKVIDRGGGPDDVLAALNTAGFPVLEPLPAMPPSWVPTSKHGLRLMRRAAVLTSQGMTRDEIAEEIHKSKRTVQRYLAAAMHLGLLNHQPQRRTP